MDGPHSGEAPPPPRRLASRLASSAQNRHVAARVLAARAMASNRTTYAQRSMLLEERLIEAVRKRRPLWDSSTPLHKNVRVLVYCWQQVANEMGLDEHAIKKKWKGLRDYFFRQVRELERNGKDVMAREGDVNCLWPMFDRLTFLMDNKRKYTNFNDYKMTNEERGLLTELNEYDRRQRPDYETVIFHVPSPELEKSSTPTPSVTSENETEQEIADQTTLPLKIIQTTSIAATPNQEKGIVLPETRKITSSDPPPLRVFKNTPALKNRDTILNRILAEPSQPPMPPFKKFKASPACNPKKSDTVRDPEWEADLNFFKSLMPFMRALPLEDRLRVRNGIHDLILGELEALKTKDHWLGTTHRPTSSNCQEEFITPDSNIVCDIVQNMETRQNRTVRVKDEFEDEQTLLFEVDSKHVALDSDDNIIIGDD